MVLHSLDAIDLRRGLLGGQAGIFGPDMTRQDNYPLPRGDVDSLGIHPFIGEKTQLGLEGNPRIADFLEADWVAALTFSAAVFVVRFIISVADPCFSVYRS